MNKITQLIIILNVTAVKISDSIIILCLSVIHSPETIIQVLGMWFCFVCTGSRQAVGFCMNIL